MAKYNFKKIEKKWQEHWLKEGTYEPDLDKAKKPFFTLMMFPYPSAEGLHIGGVRTFTGVDIYGRLKRMQGHDVIEPIGLDGFGIHSENYAIKVGKHPKKHAVDSEKNFYRQLGSMGNGFAWNERVETYDPEYYRWTQWLFIQMFNNGLAYRKKAKVNWCPKCATVLADEQVLSGECERCSSEVTKKDLEQWFFKITDYTEKLLSGLDTIDWDDAVRTAQRNWIGRSEGAEINFKVKDSTDVLRVFTTRPDTLYGATYMVISPEHELISNLKERIKNINEVEKYKELSKNKSDEERKEGKEKTGVALDGVVAINPANNKEISIWVADYVLSGYGTGAIMAVPAHDERDFEFAKKFKLPIVPVIKPPQPIPSPPPGASAFGHLESNIEADLWVGPGTIMNSEEFNGKDLEDAKWAITEKVKGERKINYRLRDWLISRQRYWGPPIPMIWCDSCGKWLAEKEENLPILLPDVKEFRPTGTDKSPLANFPKFYETKCPECGGDARRETDVSDTFLDSAWYYIRYTDPKNKKEFASQDRMNKWLPVDMYIGGAEHSVLHLLYVRFISIALHDIGKVSFAKDMGGEPITSFRAHGLITKDGAKMSKSKGNVIDPDEYMKAYGIDAMRMYLAFLAPLTQGGDFNDAGIKGLTRFLERVWEFYNSRTNGTYKPKENSKEDIKKITHKTIKKVSEDIEKLQYNTAISALMVMLSQMESETDDFADVSFLFMLAPFAPHITEEIFEMRGSKESLHTQKWPEYDAKYLVDDSFNLVVQINGKLRATVEVPFDITEEDAKKIALEQENVETHLGGKEPKKVIYVKGRLVSIVV
ncbi:MAG: leucine--tRNA ligase [bacterium]|nr:leucine--tRNA ligase [bacterium]